jgi:hypothetical protein
MGKPVKIRVAGAVACFLILGAASCNTNQPVSGNGSPTLKFIGDSITVQSTPDINAHYGGTYDIGIHAVLGIDTYLMAHNVTADAESPPAVELINLGTNDALRLGTAITGTKDGQPIVIEAAQTISDIDGRLDAFATEFPASTCLVFVTVNSHNPSWGPANAQAMNDHLRGDPTLFPHLADWDAAWQASYFDTADTPHPNETGRQALLALEDQAIAGCPTTTPPA